MCLDSPDQPLPVVMTDKPARARGGGWGVGRCVHLARAALGNTTSGHQLGQALAVDNCCVESLWVETNTFLALLGQTVKGH